MQLVLGYGVDNVLVWGTLNLTPCLVLPLVGPAVCPNGPVHLPLWMSGAIFALLGNMCRHSTF